MRLTRKKDNYPCRIINCQAEDWMIAHFNACPEDDICKDCPFEKYISHLADYEDIVEAHANDHNPHDLIDLADEILTYEEMKERGLT